MRRDHILALAGLLALAGPAQAQMHGGHHHGGHTPPAGPYAGLEQRRIKALSDQQIADLRAGRGMGLALPAELNGYPGPMHVLEHAAALGLTAGQAARAQALRAAMLAEARPLGARLVALEERLDALFARGEADAARLEAHTAEIGLVQGRLRAVHLAAHIAMRDVLSPAQRVAYARLRGYAD